MLDASQNKNARVYLRGITRKDRTEFLALMHLSRSLHEPWISPPLTDESFHTYLQRCEKNDHAGLLICHTGDDAITGVVNLNNIVRGSFLSASLGYYAGAPYAGQGLMREGLELVRSYAFSTLGLHRLEANIQPKNTRSIELVKRCGFEKEGLSRNFLFIDDAWREHERWTAIHPRATLQP